MFARKMLTLSVVALILGGCYGRPQLHGNASAIAHETGLQVGQPAVVVFSALWCHPCREEIEALNSAHREFATSIQFRGLLVEGLEKGSLVQQSDIPQFKSFSGQSAEYSVKIDPVWRLFDSIPTPQGHALPTMVVLNAALEVEQVIQQSLDYDTQLRPLLQKLARGQSTTLPPSKPTGGDFSETIEKWEQRAEVAANPNLLKNLEAGWEKGLKQYAFSTDQMPLELGTIAFNWDGANTNTPKSAAWVEDTPISICTMNFVLNPDATVASSNGICRRK